MSRGLTTEQFITRATIVHNGYYSYDNVVYQNFKSKVLITCPIHGGFHQRVDNHLAGKTGCAICGRVKRKITNMQKYGCVNPLNSVEIVLRIKQSNIKTYGVEYVSQSPIIQARKVQNCLTKHGVEYSAQLLSVRAKTKYTNLVKFGCETTFKCPDIKEKIKHTNIVRFGVPHYNQKHMVDILPLINDYNWMYDQYITQNKTTVQLEKELGVSNVLIGMYLAKHNINITYNYKYSYKCVAWLTALMQEHNIHIQHALNGGEYAIPNTKLVVDGYCVESNTVYEFHGNRWHGNPKLFDSNDLCHPYTKSKTAGELYSKTILREERIRELGYNLVIMWESDFDKQKESKCYIKL